MNYNLNIDYSNDSMEIENLLAIIDNNKDNIQNKINNADVLLLSIGNIDIENESYKTIYNELKELFKKIRLINNKEIIYISPYKIKSTILIKKLCKEFNILFINGSSFINKKNLLSQMIYRKIDSTYNNKTY